MTQSLFGGDCNTSLSLQLSLKYKERYLGHMPKGSLPKTYKKKIEDISVSQLLPFEDILYHRCFIFKHALDNRH